MFIDTCPNNVRCDTANCHKFAKFNINTNGYKKNFCLCENCFNELYLNMQKVKRLQKNVLEKNK